MKLKIIFFYRMEDERLAQIPDLKKIASQHALLHSQSLYEKDDE